VRTVFVLNGPNLGRLGQREVEIYGTATYRELVETCQAAAADLGVAVDVRQTDDEATLISWLHEAADRADAVVLNPAAFTHYSYAVRDAVAAVGKPVVEVHLSNPAAREGFRQVSVTAPVSVGTITGFGLESYRLALTAAAGLLQPRS
jgi:3-dehydroquinate dehydratase-2